LKLFLLDLPHHPLEFIFFAAFLAFSGHGVIIGGKPKMGYKNTGSVMGV
jgi:hypothetical protein